MPPTFRRQLWTCAYCNVTINDDPPSRRLHETGMRHKTNVQNSIDQEYHRAREAKKAAEDQVREMARIEAAARKAMGADLPGPSDRSAGPGLAPSSSHLNLKAKASSPPSAQGPEAYGSLFHDQLVRRQERARNGEEGADDGVGAKPGEVGIPSEWEVFVPPDHTTNRRSSQRQVAPATHREVRRLKPSARSSLQEPSERSEARAFALVERSAAGIYDDDDEEQEEDLCFLGQRGTGQPTALTRPPAKRPKVEQKLELKSEPLPVSARAQGPPLKRDDRAENEGSMAGPLGPTEAATDLSTMPNAADSYAVKPDPDAGPADPELRNAALKTDPDSLGDSGASTSARTEPGSAPNPEPEPKPESKAEVETQAESKSLGGSGLFKKRKTGTGKGTKRIVV